MSTEASSNGCQLNDDELVFGVPVIEEVKVQRKAGSSYRRKTAGAKFGSNGENKANILFNFIGREAEIDQDLLAILLSSDKSVEIACSVFKHKTNCEKVEVKSPGTHNLSLSDMTVMYPSSIRCFWNKRIIYCEFAGERFFFREAA